MAFTKPDLHISQDEQDKFTSALSNATVTDPIQKTIDEEALLVDDYSARYTLGEERKQRLIRSLVLYKLYSLIGDVSEARKDDFENAMRELRDIRDGKFPDLALASSAAAQAKYGSQTRLKTLSEA